MKGYFIAAALGYVAGILWAPRRGCELRASILDHFEAGKAEVVSGGQQIVETVKQHGNELIDGAESKYRQASATAVKAKKIAKESIDQFGENMGVIVDEGAKLFAPEQHNSNP
jgi:gas vesicle protein